MIPTILEGVRNENNRMFCLTSLKLSRALNADADKVLIDGNIFDFICLQIPKKDNVINKSIAKIISNDQFRLSNYHLYFFQAILDQLLN